MLLGSILENCSIFNRNITTHSLNIVLSNKAALKAVSKRLSSIRKKLQTEPIVYSHLTTNYVDKNIFKISDDHAEK